MTGGLSNKGPIKPGIEQNAFKYVRDLVGLQNKERKEGRREESEGDKMCPVVNHPM